MRRWLITASTEANLQELHSAIAAQGGTVDDDSSMPLGSGEQVVEADGPDDLPARLCEDPAVLRVYPDSPKHPFD